MNLHNQHIVLATHNAGKIPEISALITPYGCTVDTAGNLGVSQPIEDGATFAENALIKARHTAKHTGKIAMADDSGLCVRALNNAPGIHSARYAGADKDFGKAMHRLQSELTKHTDTSAHFVCALAVVTPDGQEMVFQGEVHGDLSFPPTGDKGFGYDPIFIATGYTKTFAEIDPQEKHAISHRADAFKKMIAHCFL